MIKALGRKFILVNMALISAVLLVVFIALCTITYRQAVQATRMALEQAIDMRQGGMPEFEFGLDREDRPSAMLSIPAFCVVIGDDGDYQVIQQENISVTDDMLSRAVSGALDSGAESGTLGGLSLRYLIRESPQGVKIAFADTGTERSTMLRFILNAVIVGLVSLLAIFLISLFLSRLAIRPAREAWEQQRRFVADASHELKTPITVILANTEILQAHREQRIEDQIKWVDSTRDEAMQMKGLVEDLLYLAKTDGETRPEVMEPVNLSDLVLRYTLPFEAVAFERSVSITTRVTPDLEIVGSQSELKQLVGILLDNACKYAGAGGEITVLLREEADRAVLSVTNTGPPIPAEDLSNIFRRFYRGDRARGSGQGYGLGLAIASGIVEAHHGGKLTVTSTEAEGTTFSARFPLHKI